LGDERGFVNISDVVLFDDGDEFEAMEINSGGGVTI
jgi:hypothetical protein